MLKSIKSSVTTDLQAYANNGLWRVRKKTAEDIMGFSSNDYLGLSMDPRVINSLAASAKKYGFGGTGSPLLAGYRSPHIELEKFFCKLFSAESAVIFSSGYLANIVVTKFLACYIDCFVVDEQCHRSIWEGIRTSRKPFRRFSHNNVQALSRTMQKVSGSKAICAEHLYSMSGQVADLKQYAEHVNANTVLLIDEAHSFGVVPLISLPANVIRIIPMGKAIGGNGAVVVGPKYIIEGLIQWEGGYTYSTALSPAISSAALTSIKIMLQEKWRLGQLRKIISNTRRLFKEAGLPLEGDDNSPIQMLQLKKFKNMQDVMGNGLVPVMRYPTVAKNNEALRISLNVHHRKKDITSLLKVLGSYEKSPTK